MSNLHGEEKLHAPANHDDPAHDTTHDVLQKVIFAHQQALLLLQQTEMAYARLVPRQLLTLLERDSIVDLKLGDQIERKLTVMFSDIRNFTPLSESMTPRENFEFINSYLSQMEPVISKHHGIIDKYMGDAIMALFIQSADDAVAGSIAMLDKLDQYNAGRGRAGYKPVQIGIGLNTGMVMIGTVGGANRMDSTVIGDAVNLTARIEQITKAYNVPLLISQNTLYDLADPSRYDIRFLDRVRVKGKTQPLSLFEVFDNDPADLKKAKRATKPAFEEAIAYYHLKEIPRSIELLDRCLEAAPDDIPARTYQARCEEYLATGKHAGTDELNNHLEWRDEFQIGIEEIDSAHRLLYDKIDAFISTGRKGGHESVRGVLAFLASHTETHFKADEGLMRQHNYPFFESHQQEHKRFIENFTALNEEATAESCDPLFLSFRTQLLLFDWFSGHIAKADRHMGRYLLNAIQPAHLT